MVRAVISSLTNNNASIDMENPGIWLGYPIAGILNKDSEFDNFFEADKPIIG